MDGRCWMMQKQFQQSSCSLQHFLCYPHHGHGHQGTSLNIRWHTAGATAWLPKREADVDMTHQLERQRMIAGTLVFFPPFFPRFFLCSGMGVLDVLDAWIEHRDSHVTWWSLGTSITPMGWIRATLTTAGLGYCRWWNAMKHDDTIYRFDFDLIAMGCFGWCSATPWDRRGTRRMAQRPASQPQSLATPWDPSPGAELRHGQESPAGHERVQIARPQAEAHCGTGEGGPKWHCKSQRFGANPWLVGWFFSRQAQKKGLQQPTIPSSNFVHFVPS